MRVSDICTTTVVHVAPGATVQQAAKLMRQQHVGSLVIVDHTGPGAAPIGMLTDRDIVISVVAPGVRVEVVTVGDVMSQPVYTCDADDDLVDAISRMRDKGVRRLVVVDRAGSLAGILTADDAYQALGNQMHELGRAVQREQVKESVLKT